MPLCKKSQLCKQGSQAGILVVLPVIPDSRFPIPYFLYIDIKCSVNIR
ncbi:hypothetical protein [Moorena sp. SIO4A5]|nr:hypothetical protein [Moorena sp. SIO4A5]NEO24856.1 hypothetical protein [Moorena sp. SIO4A5]